MEMSLPSLKEGKTEQPVPVSRFCYSNCNRFGLFVLALFKLVLSVVLLFILIISIILCFMFVRPLPLYQVVLLFIAIFIDVIDIIIGLVANISVCVKDHEIMKMYYMYSIYIFGPINVLCCLAFYKISQDNGALLILFSLFFLFLIMQICLNYMMKNEVLMLRSNTQFPL